MFSPGLRRADIEQALGPAFGGTVPNNYRLVREAIDRGVTLEEVKAGSNVAVELKKLVLRRPPSKGDAKADPSKNEKKQWSLFGAR
jgi:pilus assembly protein CpaE